MTDLDGRFGKLRQFNKRLETSGRGGHYARET